MKNSRAGNNCADGEREMILASLRAAVARGRARGEARQRAAERRAMAEKLREIRAVRSRALALGRNYLSVVT